MPTFTYDGRDVNGNLVAGERFADSEDHLSGSLLKEGITPIHINIKTSEVSAFDQIKNLFAKRRVKSTDLALFTRQMYTLSKAGVPISNAMKHLSKTSRTKLMTDVLLNISQKIESGQNLATAMESYPDVFTPLMIAMIQIGQNTGRLDEVFLQLSEYLELEQSTIKRVKTAIRYPIFVVSAIVIGIFIINVFVIPVFAKVYVQANIPLPWMTRVLIDISNFFKDYWIYLLVVTIIIIISIYQYLKSEQGRYNWNKFQLKIPIVGFLLQRIILLRFAETFMITVNSGININDGLSLVAQSVNNVYARDEILAMKDSISRGNSIVQAASLCKLFTGMELQMLAIAEQTGELGSMLNEIALYYRREVDYDLKRLLDIMEPLLLIGIAAMVLFLALAVYMPIWSMVKLVHKG